ncbi:hypothetical protein [Pseudovibrio sp. POLY-S9]|uniref:hypothetical protein n=1 Tax=Pseudovibrio sp. POLY-S9 TaxID=1576596 RepID=UPI0009E8FC50|nr:hypothetical protein [Pseudovibrio sp. POLY-S9]
MKTQKRISQIAQRQRAISARERFIKKGGSVLRQGNMSMRYQFIDAQNASYSTASGIAKLFWMNCKGAI